MEMNDFEIQLFNLDVTKPFLLKGLNIGTFFCTETTAWIVQFI